MIDAPQITQLLAPWSAVTDLCFECCQVNTPTYNRDLADASIKLVEAGKGANDTTEAAQHSHD